MTTHSICMVCHEYPPARHGGIGTFTQVVARELQRAGWSVRVAGVYRGWNGPTEDVDDGVQVLRLPRPAGDIGGFRARSGLYRTIAEWSRRGEIELVEIPDAEGWSAGWPRLRVPLIARVHGSATYFARELGRKLRTTDFLIERAGMRRADDWCAVSAYAGAKTKAAFGLKPPAAISYVPVTAPPPSSGNRSWRKVLFTGTLTPKKGIVQLMRAWPGVIERVPDAELHVYGKEGSAPGCWSHARLRDVLGQNTAGTVRFYGHRDRPEVLEALATAGVAVFPSYAEAFAFAPVEAMASGCPTVYSRRTSGPELIEDRRHGLLIDPEDVAGITSALVRLLEDDALAAELGEAGRKRVLANFTADRIVPRIADFYRDCIGRFRRGTFLSTSTHPARSATAAS